jgi:hypothetical protein
MEGPFKKPKLSDHMMVVRWRPGERCSLLHIPRSVIRAHVLPLWEWDDCSSLARTCCQLRDGALLQQGRIAGSFYARERSDVDARQVYLIMEKCFGRGLHSGEDVVLTSKRAACRIFSLQRRLVRGSSSPSGRRVVHFRSVMNMAHERHGTMANMLEMRLL